MSQELFDVFDVQARVGITKHMGGQTTTDELIRLCRIDAGSYVLDAGCGVGATPAYLAETIGCRVMGVDLRERMIERARERAERQSVAHLTEFRTADVQHLPFEDNLFDAVLSESVTAFPADKQAAVNEYVRVTKPGGCVGLNEATWLKPDPPQELKDWVSQEMSTYADLLTPQGWEALLENAGLHNLVARVRRIELRSESAKQIRRYGWKNMIPVWGRTLRLLFFEPAVRAVFKQAGKMPANAFEYFGYGLYVGQKV